MWGRVGTWFFHWGELEGQGEMDMQTKEASAGLGLAVVRGLQWGLNSEIELFRGQP